MDKGITLLMLLEMFYRRQRAADKSFLRAAISNFFGEKVEDNEFSNLALGLVERGYVIEEQNALTITAKGTSIANTLGRRSFFPDDLQLFEREIDTYLARPEAERDNMIEELLRGVEKKTVFLGSNIQPISGTKLFSNAILGRLSPKVDKLTHSFFRSDIIRGLRTDSERYRLLGRLEHFLEREKRTPIVVKPTNDGFVVIAINRVEQTHFEGMTLDATNFDESDLQSQQIPTDFITKEFIGRLKEKGYSKVGFGLRFVDFTSVSKKTSPIGTLRYYDGLTCLIDPLPSTQNIVVWVDLTTKFIPTIFDYVEYLKACGLAEQEIPNLLVGKKVRVLPSENAGTIVSIDLTQLRDMQQETIPEVGITYAEFWKGRHSIILSEDKQPLVEVQLGDKTFHYPFETVYLDRKIAEEELELDLSRETTALNPEVRIAKTASLIHKIFNEPIENDLFKIEFNNSLLSWEELKRIGYCRGFFQLTPPNLKFNSIKQGTEVTSDPRSIFKFGPYSSEKEIKIVGVYAPPYLKLDQIETFVNELRAAYKRHGFGNLEFQGRNVFRYGQDIDDKRIDRIIELCPAVTTRNSIILAILPERRTDLYVPFKVKFYKARKVPIQVIMESTFRRILRGDYGPVKGLIIQIYTKLLGKKEAVWILEDPADENRGTVYIGIGFSATPLAGKKANSFAALCDAKGREIDWKPIGVPFKGRYIDDEWFRGFLDFATENLRPNTGRVVVFRKGDTYESEINTMQKVIDQSKPFYGQNFDFVSVINETRRIYSYGAGWINPEPGVFVVLNDKEAILASSSHHELVLSQGTVVPVRIVISVGPDDVTKMVSEYRALTYLNWVSPVALSKYPLILNLSNRIAELVKERVDEELLSTYLPS